MSVQPLSRCGQTVGRLRTGSCIVTVVKRLNADHRCQAMATTGPLCSAGSLTQQLSVRTREVEGLFIRRVRYSHAFTGQSAGLHDPVGELLFVERVVLVNV